MDLNTLVPLVLLIIAIIGILFGFLYERRSWNNGFCKLCKNPWKYFDTDSQGGRGYTCECNQYIWVSWPIDKIKEVR